MLILSKHHKELLQSDFQWHFQCASAEFKKKGDRICIKYWHITCNICHNQDEVKGIKVPVKGCARNLFQTMENYKQKYWDLEMGKWTK